MKEGSISKLFPLISEIFCLRSYTPFLGILVISCCFLSHSSVGKLFIELCGKGMRWFVVGFHVQVPIRYKLLQWINALVKSWTGYVGGFGLSPKSIDIYANMLFIIVWKSDMTFLNLNV